MAIRLFMLAAAALLLTAFTPASAAPAQKTPKAPSALDFTIQNIDGKPVPLSHYRGKVVLVVNTASLCGNTPQYASLEKLYQTYQSKGLRILAFPANNFGSQEPGANGEIKEFCTGKYKTTFDLFSKISVKGDDQAPLYKFLTDKTTDPQFGGDIEWNFAKFVIGRSGHIVARFPAGHDPLSPDVIAVVEQQLKAHK
ncbi:MAG: glutathione peroxidase [Armatimonadota bacterium]|nr:glutathione peroxidase [Armatimonadota bacterium]